MQLLSNFSDSTQILKTQKKDSKLKSTSFWCEYILELNSFIEFMRRRAQSLDFCSIKIFLIINGKYENNI
jgi:hypothetical protein